MALKDKITIADAAENIRSGVKTADAFERRRNSEFYTNSIHLELHKQLDRLAHEFEALVKQLEKGENGCLDARLLQFSVSVQKTLYVRSLCHGCSAAV